MALKDKKIPLEEQIKNAMQSYLGQQLICIDILSNMKFIGLFVILALCAVSFASIRSGNFTHPDHPGKCVYGNLILSPGEAGYPDDKCVRVLCFKENGYGKVHGCGAMAVEPPCVFGDYVNRNAQYPDCCEKHVICPEAV
ncbi:uncharacterized protein LOC106094256 [Stomoxys calcitrans]|uniref:Single domain-containing protein n=1 Tax=Stomoxys calcitrans TaxID=35570 RepID=A0A1I8Q3M5_STOCA|nr:uncharacterized protein LOC106094256 [Stomoxys calcitrans]